MRDNNPLPLNQWAAANFQKRQLTIMWTLVEYTLLGYQLGLHLLKYVYLFSECCRHKQKELEVKRGTEIHNTMVKVKINRQIEIYISNSRTQEETVEGCVNALKIIF